MKEGPHYILSQRHMSVLFGLSPKFQGRPNLITLPLWGVGFRIISDNQGHVVPAILYGYV